MQYPDPSKRAYFFLENTSGSTDALRYLSWSDGTVDTSITADNRRIMPRAGRVVEIGCISYVDAGSTAIGVHLDQNVTPSGTVTITPPTTAPATFGTCNVTFSKGQELTISMDPTNAITTRSSVVVVEWD